MGLRRGWLSFSCRRTVLANLYCVAEQVADERAHRCCMIAQRCSDMQRRHHGAGYGSLMDNFAQVEASKGRGRWCHTVRSSMPEHHNINGSTTAAAPGIIDSRSSPGVHSKGSSPASSSDDPADHGAINGRSSPPDVVQCSRTFCPTDLGDRCPLAHKGLPLPRGDEQELLRHHQSWGDGTTTVRRPPLKCPRAYRALLVDAAGTLIAASQSTEEIYREIGRKYGIKLSEEEIAAKYKAAYGQPWCRYRMRYEEDGRFFWQLIVQEATGCKDPALLEDLYQYYTTDKAWHIGDRDAEKAMKAMRAAGLKIAVVSNFDTRLRPLMRVLGCYDWFDAIIVSAEVGMEKPNPEIFWRACEELGVKAAEVLHVGDDRKNDIVGASAAGCDSLLWGEDVSTFKEVAHKLGVSVI